jgi:HEAT repeat protein
MLVVVSSMILLLAGPSPSPLASHCNKLNQSPRPSVEELVQGLEVADLDKRSQAGDDLACYGTAAAPAVPTIISRLFNTEVGEISANAVQAVAFLGPVAVPALIEALDDPAYWIRINTIEALRSIGPPAAQALPALRERRKLPGYDVALIDLAIRTIEAKP